MCREVWPFWWQFANLPHIDSFHPFILILLSRYTWMCIFAPSHICRGKKVSGRN